ncbi:DUF6468 domain-containing protein [uncultured Nisaea sp.]|uniref:DUF6468 domain-containing protein n=1 Tax=uncultured Nisaea sp. TaxID=538215 RepID=UPI0030EE2191|tara:strand:- start:2131 stop:2742 length:612 start_codon:yes stop_codon:yes gene_type:complete
MSETILPLVLDGLLVVLLLTTIVYAMILNRKLNRLRGNHDEMEVFVDKLNVACARAESATAGLRNAGENGKSVFREAASKAEALRDELAFLVERADIVSGRLASVSEGTKVVSADPRSQVAAAQSAAPQSVAGHSASAKSEQGRKPGAKRPAPAPRRGQDAGRGHEMGRAGAGRGAHQADESASGSPRSEAEEELLKALRNAR